MIEGARGRGPAVTRPTLIIPVENQVRELDPKLLLACQAARRGFPCVIGSRREVEMGIDGYPRGIFLSKSMTIRSLLAFQIMRSLGHEVVAWDEEALVHLPPDMYYSRRLDRRTLRRVAHLFAWGEDNAQLWRGYPDLPPGFPIHVTGNPRSDLLRPEIRRFYDPEATALRAAHGDFILLNTNFNHVNGFFPKLNLFQPVKRAGAVPRFGRGARGMTREFAEALRDHKQAIFDAFQELIPTLAETFPEQRIVVRPHPTEKQDGVPGPRGAAPERDGHQRGQRGPVADGGSGAGAQRLHHGSGGFRPARPGDLLPAASR